MCAFVIFGFSFMFSSIAVSIAPPAVLLCCRFVIAVITLSLLALFDRRVGKRALLKLSQEKAALPTRLAPFLALRLHAENL